MLHKVRFIGKQKQKMVITNAGNEDSGVYTCAVVNVFQKKMTRSFYIPPVASKFSVTSVFLKTLFEKQDLCSQH
jgi:hypothetical protein